MSKLNNVITKLNEFPVLANFHDMGVLDMKIEDNNVILRLSLYKYLDNIGILDDEDHVAILEVKYTNILITKLNLYGIINFRNLIVMSFTDIDDFIELNLYNADYNCFFDLSFKFESYKWKIIDIVEEKEFNEYCEEISKYNEFLYEINEYNGPRWSKI